MYSDTSNDYKAEFIARVHRTWVQLLTNYVQEYVAAIALDTTIDLEPIGGTWDNSERGYKCDFRVIFSVPVPYLGLVKAEQDVRSKIERVMGAVLENQRCPDFDEQAGEWFFIAISRCEFRYRVSLLDVEEGWDALIRSYIASPGVNNQAAVTEKVFAREQRQVLLYNEMKFASQSEIRIAQELEQRKVLFFPLAMAVRADTGAFYKDHREVDFLVCQDGKWGIMEVSHHPDRYEKDSEKNTWFKESGILCVEHYSAERCYQSPASVVTQFLNVLAKHK